MTSCLIPLVPLFWLFSKNLAYLGIVQAFSGLAWAGFNLCSVNYLYDATAPAKGPNISAILIAVTVWRPGSARCSGLSDDACPALTVIKYYGFLISGVLRATAALVFLPGLKEVRKVSTVLRELFHILTGGRPADRRFSTAASPLSTTTNPPLPKAASPVR